MLTSVDAEGPHLAAPEAIEGSCARVLPAGRDGDGLSSTTPARRCTPLCSSVVTWNGWPQRVRQPALRQRPFAGEHATRSIHARGLTLQLFDADPADTDVVFTANASGAIRILAEAFPFSSGSRLVMTADNHNSVNGLRRSGPPASSRIDTCRSTPTCGADPAHGSPERRGRSLFAFPAQSNFSGVRHPLEWVSARSARLSGAARRRVVCGHEPAFAVGRAGRLRRLSYYKLFGYPTGVGALSRGATRSPLLRRRFFGGGTVQFVSVQNRLSRARAAPRRSRMARPNFLAMPAVCDGLRWLEEIGMRAVERRVSQLTLALLDRLIGLGDRATIYGPRTLDGRGGTRGLQSAARWTHAAVRDGRNGRPRSGPRNPRRLLLQSRGGRARIWSSRTADTDVPAGAHSPSAVSRMSGRPPVARYGLQSVCRQTMRISTV